MGNPFQFAARHYEPAGGIYQARARWYDPQLRRFMSEDPIGLSGGLNPYTYADNDPINKTDPMGLCSYVGSRSNPIAGKPCNPCPSDWTRGADGRCRSGRGESDVPCPPGICANEKERVIPPHHSSCNQAAVPCDLYKPNEDQWNQIRDILLNEVDVAKSDFCAALQLSGLAMIHNQVALYNNDARWVVDNPKRHDYVYGEAPELIRGRSARGMYIKIPITVLKVMHEAIHGVYQQGTRWPRTYGDGGPVEINDMAKGCMRGRR